MRRMYTPFEVEGLNTEIIRRDGGSVIESFSTVRLVESHFVGLQPLFFVLYTRVGSATRKFITGKATAGLSTGESNARDCVDSLIDVSSN